MNPKNNTNPKNTPPAGTKTHKANCPCPVCKRVRGRQEPTGAPKVGAVDPKSAGAAIAVGMTNAIKGMTETLTEAREIMGNPKALELASEVAAQKRTIEQLRTERTKLKLALDQRNAQYNGQETLFSNVRTECEGLKRELAEVTRKAGELERSRAAQADVLMELHREIERQHNRIEQLRNQLSVVEAGAKADQIAFRAALWGAVETLTAGTTTVKPDDPKWINTPPAELAGVLIEAVEYGRIGIEMVATVEELLEIEGDSKEWRAQVRHAIDTKIEAAEGPLRAEQELENGGLLATLSIVAISFVVGGLTSFFVARYFPFLMGGRFRG